MIEVPLWTEHTTENRPTDQHGESEKSAERGKKNREHNITECDPGSEKNNRSERTGRLRLGGGGGIILTPNMTEAQTEGGDKTWP